MSPPLLRRFISYPPCSRVFELISTPVSIVAQVRNVSTRRNKPKTVLVQLTRNIPKLGVKGDVVTVKCGRMRNTLYPYSMAQYVRPGTDTFLTQHKLAIPFGPNYRRLLRQISPDPAQLEFEELFEKTRERLIKEEKTRPGPGARDDVLFQLDKYQKEIEKSDKWGKEEKEELLRFLRIQATSWGTLRDDLRSEKVRRTKERMLLESWQEFTKDMNVEGGGGIEEHASAMDTAIPEDVKATADGIQTIVGTGNPVGQTDLHEIPATDLNSERKLSEKKDIEETNITQ